MTTTITVRDETTAGELLHEMSLEFTVPRVTIRELIESRVRQEVDAYNRSRPEHYQGLVQPEGAEATLNGYRLGRARELSWERQAKKAVGAFEKGQVLVLVNNRQTEALDEVIELTPDTQVRFLRLILLVGG